MEQMSELVEDGLDLPMGKKRGAVSSGGREIPGDEPQVSIGNLWMGCS